MNSKTRKGMAEKLSWTELRRAIASRAGVSEKTAGAFLNALTSQLLAGLRTDKMVKINGLGTFKLQAVAPRKSVNVKTGEEIVIPGYNKVVFTPEAGVKELVERGADASSVTTEVVRTEVDPLKKLGEQAEEIVDLLADLGQDPKKTKKGKAKVKKEEPVVVETVVEPTPEPEPVVEPVVEPTPEPEPVVEPEPVRAPEKPKKQYHFLRDLLICVVVLLLLLFGGYFFLRSQLSNWLEEMGQPKEKTEVAAPVQEPVEVIAPDTTEVSEEPMVEETAVEETVVETPQEEAAPYAELITIEEMHEASRLTWMAKRYYGDKKYWPYLYDANRDVIVNPSMIKTGTPIRVPKLTAAQRDTTNAETKARLEALRIEAEAACRK